MWRPKDWDIMDYLSVEEQMESPLQAMKYFEAGADAILKAIWELAKDSPAGTFTFDTNTINIFEEVKDGS